MQNYDESDDYLNKLSDSIITYVMPGESDISSSYFPQIKLNEVIFISSKEKIGKTLFLKSNPLNIELYNKEYLITSGQNIDNIRKYSKINENLGYEKYSAVNLAEKTLEWGHLCPSAPDTLRTWPVVKDDPMILTSIPNVYIIGNQKFFEEKFSDYKYIKGKAVRYISIPRFSESFSFVVFNTKNLAAFEYKLEFFN